MPLSVLSFADCDAELYGEVKIIKVHIIASRAISYRSSCVVIWHIVSFGQKDTDRPFEVIVGKSVTGEGTTTSFGLVSGYDSKPKRRLFEVLQAQGMQMNQAVTFLTDGGDTVRELTDGLNTLAEHILDWFHITMRTTVLNQMAKGISAQHKGEE